MTQLVENLIGPAAACHLLGIQSHTLLRAINDGFIPAYRIGESVRFRPSELRHPALTGLDEYYQAKAKYFAA
ncbi:helix-turn-helix domain-containing protein [Candidatus Poriferisocius sp.]|uniref:helix-turn-helix domain-containing protein n=1 Tax=Candidatus Poriferisocius sp. TaxID=3101276 RepID=UPI003B59CA71